MKIMQEFKQNTSANNDHHSKSIEITSQEHRSSKSQINIKNQSITSVK